MLNKRYSLLTIYQLANITESFGDIAPAWEALPGVYKGFIQALSGNEKIQDGKKGEHATHRLYTDVKTPGVYGYRVTQNGKNYIMIYTMQSNGVSGTGHHKEIILSEVV